jgi:VanZ family protein
MSDRSPSRRWTDVAVATVVLLVASVLPSPLGRHPEWGRVGPDKLLHLVGHAGYAVLLADALGAGRWRDRDAAVLAACVSAVHGLLVGRLQRWVPGRAFEPADAVAGLVGAVVGAVGWYVASGPLATGAGGRGPAPHRGSSVGPRR